MGGRASVLSHSAITAPVQSKLSIGPLACRHGPTQGTPHVRHPARPPRPPTPLVALTLEVRLVEGVVQDRPAS